MIANIRNTFLRRVLAVLYVPLYPVVALGDAVVHYARVLSLLPNSFLRAWWV